MKGSITMFKKAVLKFKDLGMKVVNSPSSPSDIASGAALGIFIGMTPTFGAQMPIALVVAQLLKQNKIAALLGVWVTNPLTAPAIYWAEYELGKRLLGRPSLTLPDELTWNSMTTAGSDIFLPFILGSLFCGVFFGGITHAVLLKAIPAVRQRRSNKRTDPQLNSDDEGGL